MTWWDNVMPPRRRPVTWRSAVPLIAAMLVLLIGALVLDLAGVVLFAAPAAFALVIVMPWFWWMHINGYSGLAGWRGVVALLTRLALVGLFIILLAQPQAVRKHRELAVVFAVDMSASIHERSVDAAIDYVLKLVHQKPGTDEAGLVVFGRDAAVELPPSMSFPFEAINLQVARDGTNIAGALALSAAILPDQKQGRIVLITDGAQTEGDLQPALDDLKSRQIPVDVLGIEYDYEHEVWLERLELPRLVKVGETYEAAVILSSISAGAGTLVLKENGQEIARQEVEYQPGKNRYVVPIYMRQPGYYEYEATIDVPRERDGWLRNNRAISYLYLEGEGRVLVVSEPAGDERDWRSMVQALRGGERHVEVINAYQFPNDPLSLLPYDCIIFPNVPADAFVATQLQALHDAVYNQGSGFVMVGGPNSFGPGGYHRTPVEDVLPVSMDVSQKRVMPKGALVIVLHTCEFPEGNTWGKNITKQAIKVLSSEDEVGVLIYSWGGAFQSGERWLFPLTPASEYDRLAQLINAANIGDMPSFAPTMQMGLAALKQSDASSKHMIIISDGDPSPPPPELLREYVANQISVTTVTIFPHGDMDVAIMREIANATGGRYYWPRDANLLPSIFIKEAKTLRRSMIQNKTIVPQVQMPSPILKGLEFVPPLHGYVLTTPKARSATILQTPEEEEVEPVLSTWRYGVGKTAAFTSDLSPNWARDWVSWENYQAFVNQLITDVSRAGNDSQLRVHAYSAGNRGTIIVDDYHPQSAFLRVEAAVSGPRNERQVIMLEQVAPQRYEGRFELWGEGRYQVLAQGAGDGRQERAHGGFVVPYSHEYLRFRSDPIALAQIAQQTGGRLLVGDETGDRIFGIDRQDRRSSRPVFDWFLIALACLVPLDVGIRRVQLDFREILKWLGISKANVPSQETFTALLRRKQTVEATLQRQHEPGEAREPGISMRSQLEVDLEPVGSAGEAKPAKVAQVEVVPDRESTTERLLALKRRRQQEDDPNQDGAES